jgi:hypothetical protein
VCSEDLIENTTSACLVAVALQLGWQFIYKEHTVPLFIFRNHHCWNYLKVASRVVLTEDYTDYICEKELREKCLYSPKNRTCRFEYDPNGKRLLCLPFFCTENSWLTGEQYIEGVVFRESDLGEIRDLIRKWSERGDLLVKHHPSRMRDLPIDKLPPETYDRSAVREVLFLGWTQGLFECIEAGIPAKIVLMRPMESLTETGRKYSSHLQERGFLTSTVTMLL